MDRSRKKRRIVPFTGNNPIMESSGTIFTDHANHRLLGLFLFWMGVGDVMMLVVAILRWGGSIGGGFGTSRVGAAV